MTKEELEKENAELKAQISLMKCCGNCDNASMDFKGVNYCFANCFYDCRSNQMFNNKDSKIDDWKLIK